MADSRFKKKRGSATDLSKIRSHNSHIYTIGLPIISNSPVLEMWPSMQYQIYVE